MKKFDKLKTLISLASAVFNKTEIKYLINRDAPLLSAKALNISFCDFETARATGYAGNSNAKGSHQTIVD
ncbi:hypothetical protein, partial [Candidatus Symbiopectobacterium sp. NZEC135]|uniref:hypothetical protein n=1 Tax=Candidatus Symbiopectobacterium sp. NZEC135 TaxID=2820471 RepID=UPI002226A42B